MELRDDGGEFGTAAEVGPSDDRYEVTGLEPATTYVFRVVAVGPSNEAPSAEVTATTRNAPPVTAPALSAAPQSEHAVRLRWEAVDRAAGYEVEVHTADPAADVVGDADHPRRRTAGWSTGSRAGDAVHLPGTGGERDRAPGRGARRRARRRGVPAGPCEPTATRCASSAAASRSRRSGAILERRLVTGWRRPQPAPGSERTGLFTFFDPANVELVVKMLDGRSVNDAFWTFYGALSDVEYWVTVRDTESGELRTYRNEPYEICGRGDTTAFVMGPEEPSVGDGPCRAATRRTSRGPRAAGLVEAAVDGSPAEVPPPARPAPIPCAWPAAASGSRSAWENPHVAGSHGTGHVYAGLGGEVTGHFWFFRPDNLELAVKVLDGRAINGHFWILWGGLSDVGYTLHVTDTESATSHDFVNPPLTLCGGAVTDVL